MKRHPEPPDDDDPPLPDPWDESPPDPDYLHYTPEATKVVSGPLGPVKNYPGRRFVTKKQALAYWRERAGRIIDDVSVPGRWIFRVRRDA